MSLARGLHLRRGQKWMHRFYDRVRIYETPKFAEMVWLMAHGDVESWASAGSGLMSWKPLLREQQPPIVEKP